MSKLNIYLLTRSEALYSSSRIIQAAKYRGHTITPIDYMHCSMQIRNNKLEIIYNQEILPLPDAVIPRIAASYTAHGILLLRQFELLGVFSTVSPDALVRTRNKFNCLQELAACGIDVPNSAMNPGLNNHRYTLNALGKPPIIIKLLEGTHGLGVLKSDSVNDASGIVEAFTQAKSKVMLQEFIKESSGVDLRAIVIGDQVVAAMKRVAAKGEFRSNIHRGGKGLPISITDAQTKMAIAAAQCFNLKIAGVDMLISDNGSKVIEINSSPGIEGIETYTGKDVAQAMIKYIETKVD